MIPTTVRPLDTGLAVSAFVPPPTRGSPEFYQAVGSEGVRAMDAAGGLQPGTRTRYASEVVKWRRFCTANNYDPDYFCWSVFELFAGWMFENYNPQSLTHHVSALNDYFKGLPRYDGVPPVRATLGPLTAIKKKYHDAVLARQADPVRTKVAAVKHTELDLFFGPPAVQMLIAIALHGAPADGVDAAEILIGILFGCRAESTNGWLVRFAATGHLEVAFGQWKTLNEARLAFLPARSIPPPQDPRHPRAALFAGLRRALSSSAPRRLEFVRSGSAEAPRITANVRRLLPPTLVLQPGNRRLGAKSMRKTMASAPAAQGIPDTTIQHWGLWSRHSLTLVQNYINRTYPPDPMMASLFDFLMPVSRAPFQLGDSVLARDLGRDEFDLA